MTADAERIRNGKINISLLPYSGKDFHVTEMDNNVYVNSSNLNIIPPQMLINNLKLNIKDNLDADYENMMILNTSSASNIIVHD